MFSTRSKLVWHIHAGRMTSLNRAPRHWRTFARFAKRTITVSQPLQRWCVSTLGLPAAQVSYIPNFIETAAEALPANDLPGQEGCRIVSIANLLPPKDPLNLLRAMKFVARECPMAHLLMVGRPGDPKYMDKVRTELKDALLRERVSLLGVRTDVPAILKQCDVGVLSSATEGFPLALLEYGAMGLPTVATRVGQCEEVLESGNAGLLVSPSEPEELARAVISLLRSTEERKRLGQRFRTSVEKKYSAQHAISQLSHVYESILCRSETT